jgi:GDP-4-dehydro-6-deoxy-D-mannose reductase
VRAYEAALSAGQPGEAFNIASGQPRLLRDLLNLLLAAGKRPIATHFDESKRRPNDPRAILVDVGKLARRTGWRAEIPLDRSVRELLDYQRRLLAR